MNITCPVEGCKTISASPSKDAAKLQFFLGMCTLRAYYFDSTFANMELMKKLGTELYQSYADAKLTECIELFICPIIRTSHHRSPSPIPGNG